MKRDDVGCPWRFDSDMAILLWPFKFAPRLSRLYYSLASWCIDVRVHDELAIASKSTTVRAPASLLGIDPYT
jgi:hypothetical protein